MSETTTTNSYKQEKFIRTKNESMTITKIPITIAQWIERLNLPCLISTLGLCTIMFWIGAFKFTPTESRQIMVDVEHSPSSWYQQGQFHLERVSLRVADELDTFPEGRIRRLSNRPVRHSR